jgi:beta-galactosidase/beta-glucuronidase
MEDYQEDAQPKRFPNAGFTKVKDESFADSGLSEQLPRAVWRPNSFYLLDGEWKFEYDQDNKGLSDNWFLTHDYTDTAIWPGSVEAHIAALQPIHNPWQGQVVVWYEREFELPDIEEEHPSYLQRQLTFGACGYETRVWLNGFALKTIEGEEVHLGEYTSFSYELDEQILKKNNRITIMIRSTMDADTTRGKQESSVYKRGGIWYQTYTGGVRSIWLENVECNRLRSKIDVLSVIEDNLVRFNFTTRIHHPGQYTIRLKIYDRKEDHLSVVAEDSFPLLLEAGQKQQRVVIKIPDAILWTTENPHLYRLVAQLEDQHGYAAEIETLFGMRKIESRGSRIYLNNEQVYLNGILYQPWLATYEEIKQHMISMKSLGCNLVRIHIAGVDPRIYKLADRIGLLLWVEVPSPHRSSAISKANHKAELLRMVELIATHPSVIIWSLYNEDWGAQDIETSEETRRYIIDLYHFMHIEYPQFLVVDNDGWRHISQRGRLKSDLLTVHLYTDSITRWKEMLNELVSGDQASVAAFPLVIGDPFFYRAQVPLIVSEWGGFGFENYGGPQTAEEKIKLIALFKEELRKFPIAGDVYTQATNIEDERNGIIDFKSGALQVPEGLLGNRPG